MRCNFSFLRPLRFETDGESLSTNIHCLPRRFVDSSVGTVLATCTIVFTCLIADVIKQYAGNVLVVTII